MKLPGLLFAAAVSMLAHAPAQAAPSRAARDAAPTTRDTTHATRARPAPSAAGQSLSQVYELALKRAETVQIQDELLFQAREQVSQARGAILPSVNGIASYRRQEETTNAVGSTISPPNQTEARLTATQPLFRGFREFALLRQRKTNAATQKLLLQNAARQLFYNTAQAYYDVLALESDEFQLGNQIEIHRKRLRELEGFVRIGRSQATDVLTLKATISSLEASLEAARGTLRQARETLAFFTGADREMELADRESPPREPDPISSYLSRVEQRPDVRSALSAVLASEEGIPLARNQHLPNADVTANYWFKRPSVALADVNWDVQFALSVPIFQGGVVVSQTREAASIVRQAELTLSQTRRAAEQEIRQFYEAFAADQRRIAKLAETAELSQKNYEAQVRQYRSGLTTNLDVLQAVTTWQDSVRLLSRQQYAAKADFARLQAASAQRKEIEIESAMKD